MSVKINRSNNSSMASNGKGNVILRQKVNIPGIQSLTSVKYNVFKDNLKALAAL